MINTSGYQIASFHIFPCFQWFAPSFRVLSHREMQWKWNAWLQTPQATVHSSLVWDPWLASGQPTNRPVRLSSAHDTAKILQKREFTGPHLTLDAQVHDVVSTNGTIVHDDIPCPQGHCTPFPQSKGCLRRYCTQSQTTNRRRLIQGFTSLYHPFVVCGFRFLGLYHKT